MFEIFKARNFLTGEASFFVFEDNAFCGSFPNLVEAKQFVRSKVDEKKTFTEKKLKAVKNG